MTIAVGFNCSDGILLASDTLYSGDVQRRKGQKLWILHQDDPCVLFGGAAHSIAALKRAKDEIRDSISRGDCFKDTLNRIDETLAKIHGKFARPGSADPDVQALVVIRARTDTSGRETRTGMYQNAQGQVSLSPVEDPAVCVGLYPLGDYFIESLFGDGMSLAWAKVVAAHLVWNCKTYASGECGGDTHLIELPKDGTPKPIKKQQTIYDLEARLAILDDVARLLIPAGQTAESTLDYRLVELTKKIQELSRELVSRLGIQYVTTPHIATTSQLLGSPSVLLKTATREDQ